MTDRFPFAVVLAADATSSSPGVWILAALLLFIAASVWLGLLAEKAIDKRRFMEGFFLGNRGLGAWALALTATVQSGGTFMGFPSLVYAYGWIVGLWIASYMVVPLTGFAILGKRLSQLSRRTGAITIPDLISERFGNRAAGLTASLIIMLFMTIMMMAQFKAGAIIMKLALPGDGMFALPDGDETGLDVKYYIGLAVFSLTVIGYTLIGGFLASVWTDLFQSVMMVLGVTLLVCLALPAAGGLEAASRAAVENTSAAFASGPGYAKPDGPGAVQQFLPPGLAVSMFFVWIFGGFAAPASMVRVMAAEKTEVLRKSIVLLSGYNCLIYPPLILICIAARSILPNLDKPDEMVPRMALLLTKDLPGGSFIGGLVLAAPFGAVMATVSCYLLVIASGIVEDIYVRLIRPHAQTRELRIVTACAMIGVGGLAIAANINPPPYLQALVVLSTSCGGAALAFPMLAVCYWRRTSSKGMISGMLSGVAVVLLLYGYGWVHTWVGGMVEAGTAAPWASSLSAWMGPSQNIGIKSAVSPHYLLGLDPVMWGLLVSGLCTWGVSRISTPPSPARVAWLFEANRPRPATDG